MVVIQWKQYTCSYECDWDEILIYMKYHLSCTGIGYIDLHVMLHWSQINIQKITKMNQTSTLQGYFNAAPPAMSQFRKMNLKNPLKTFDINEPKQTKLRYRHLLREMLISYLYEQNKWVTTIPFRPWFTIIQIYKYHINQVVNELTLYAKALP